MKQQWRSYLFLLKNISNHSFYYLQNQTKETYLPSSSFPLFTFSNEENPNFFELLGFFLFYYFIILFYNFYYFSLQRGIQYNKYNNKFKKNKKIIVLICALSERVNPEGSPRNRWVFLLFFLFFLFFFLRFSFWFFVGSC